MTPRLLDLFCGAGLGARGYASAGFDVVGVDIVDQPDYPFPFVLADALTFPLDGFDVVHASPPCQGESRLAAMWNAGSHPRLLGEVLARFAGLSVPWVVENVDNAAGPPGAYKVRLCGSSFGLAVRRHRWFWSNRLLLVPPCDHRRQGTPLGVYGHAGGKSTRGVKATRAEGYAAMGVPDRVVSWPGLVNGIPPVYTQHVGAQLLELPAENRPHPTYRPGPARPVHANVTSHTCTVLEVSPWAPAI